MAGHSKWSKIKRKKGETDKKRGKIFTRCIHEITVAVREGGGGDPNFNPRLREAIDKAKSVNMPNNNIDRAIKRATGEEKSEEQYELTYEGYGPNGVAVIVDVLTNNKNRTVSEVRHAFSKHGGTLGENGCVAWMFEKKGVLTIKREVVEEEALMDVALDAGAEDISDEGDVWEVVTPANEFHEIKTKIKETFEIDSDELMMIPSTRVALEGDSVEKMLKLHDALDDLDDVLNVWVNCDFPEDADQ